MNIQVVSPVFSKVTSPEDAKLLARILSYKTSAWKEGPFSKKEETKVKPLVAKGKFLTGFLPKIMAYCEKYNITLSLIHSLSQTSLLPVGVSKANELLTKIKLPPNILKLEAEQIEALFSILTQGRGVIHYPTGSGKTVIFLAFISLFPKANAIIIVNNTDLMNQTFKKAEAMFPGEVGIIGSQRVEPNRITVGMIQTLKNLNLDEYGKSLDILIVDETHHVGKFAKPFVRTKNEEGIYAKVLTSLQASVRVGFTGSLPYTEEGKAALEGYIGPVLASKKPKEIKRLAKVKVFIRKLPTTSSISDPKTPYKTVYKLGVVFNSRRSKQIALDTNWLAGEGRTVLIMVTEIQHGHNILAFLRRMYPNLRSEFVWAGVKGEERQKVLNLLNAQERDVVIANVVWREGIDIPTLGGVIIACENKSVIMSIQNLGRGLRKVEGVKEDVILVDYFDPSHRYLVDHFGERFSLYCEEGWIA